MNKKPKTVRYPDNLPLKLEVFKSGKTVTELAKELEVSRGVLNNTINGHYKGENIVPRLKRILEKINESQTKS